MGDFLAGNLGYDLRKSYQAPEAASQTYFATLMFPRVLKEQRLFMPMTHTCSTCARCVCLPYGPSICLAPFFVIMTEVYGKKVQNTSYQNNFYYTVSYRDHKVKGCCWIMTPPRLLIK